MCLVVVLLRLRAADYQQDPEAIGTPLFLLLMHSHRAAAGGHGRLPDCDAFADTRVQPNIPIMIHISEILQCQITETAAHGAFCEL